MTEHHGGSTVRLVAVPGFNHDYPAILSGALTRAGVAHEVERDVLPLMMPEQLTPAIIDGLRARLRPRFPGERVLYCSGVMEMFLKGTHHSLHFSGYRDWHDPARATVLAHPWSVHAAPDRAALAWAGKPPLSVGFMGSAYSNAVLVRLARLLPQAVRRRMLHGRYLRRARAVAAAYARGLPVRFALAFARTDALAALDAQAPRIPGMTLDVADMRGFTGADDAKSAYAAAMARTTYVLCPRGSENFSFRAFEALQFGRVPVIVDSDMVLPDAVPWDDLAVVVPYDRLDRIGAIIAEDHARLDADGFARRQAAGYAAMDRLMEGGWLAGELSRIVQDQWPAPTKTVPA